MPGEYANRDLRGFLFRFDADHSAFFSKTSFTSSFFCKQLTLKLFRVVWGHDADVGQVAVALRVVHSVADDEEVGNGKANVVRLDFLQAAGGLVEQRGDAQRFGMLLEEELAQVGEREACIEDVLDHEDVFAFDRLIEVLDEFDRAG